MTTRPEPSRRLATAGFTLLEVMVVVVILAVLATVAVPRLSGTERRAFDLAVDQVTDLLIMYAQRDRLERRSVGIVYDADRGWLELRVLDVEPGATNEVAQWRADRFVAPVKLPDVIDRDALAVYADGEWVDIRGWPLTHATGEDRPTIEVLLRSREGDHVATLRLAPHDVVPSRMEDGTGSPRQPIDLDAAGRSREVW